MVITVTERSMNLIILLVAEAVLSLVSTSYQNQPVAAAVECIYLAGGC